VHPSFGATTEIAAHYEPRWTPQIGSAQHLVIARRSAWGASDTAQAALSTRARSRSNFARPYIIRFTSLSRWTCPST